MEFLEVGQIVKTVGLKGEVKVYPSTHFRDSRFKKGSHLFVLDNENSIIKDLIVRSRRAIGDIEQLTFEGINSIEEAEALGRVFLHVEKDQKFLKKGEYFFCDLIGLNVSFDNGQKIGVVREVEEYKTSTLRIQTNSKKDVLIPFIDAFIKSVDLDKKEIVVNYIKGLLWE
mgnify:CR=1 FL=1